MKNCVDIGKKVIVRTNEPEELWIGTIISIWNNKSRQEIPIVKNNNEEQFIVMGKCVEFNEELYKKLQTMKWWEQFNYLSDNYKIIEEDAIRKEKYK